ncbi:hypothetical protein QQZ08_007972 [Neonectria magnoliae]|uniref:Zn(2)-C6 fungal-type domain-containing protein n=1 Tax=Neonectria magnoliae TaxID=2732573 RepID=A0ABR1HWW2_9HYPO
MDNTRVETSGGGRDDGAEPSSLDPNLPNRRACEACRARKIRCNRESPCLHCLQAKIRCIHADAKPKENRTRILITPQFEQKIDLIDRRVDEVTRLLKFLKTNRPPQAVDGGGAGCHPSKDVATPAKNPSSISTPYSHLVQPGSIAAPVVEGDSSLTAQSVFANEFLQKVVRTDSLQDSSLKMRETLDALSSIVTALRQRTTASEMAYPHARPMQRPPLSGCELPPIEKAVALIRSAKSRRRLGGTAWVYAFLPMQRFPDLCLNVYFSEDHSEADFITINAGLSSLFWDYAAHGPPELKEENLAYARMCRVNLETALSNLPMHLPASSDMIVALLFGAFHAIELSRPSLSWTLSSKASELCQTLGYHRLASMKNDTKKDVDHHTFLFWNVYFVDKSLSLRLGRASTIPDWDVAVPFPSMEDPGHGGIWPFFVLWIGAAKCQGNIYELLYSPDSISQPDHVRQARVQALVTELHGLEKMTRETHAKWHDYSKEAIDDDLMSFFMVSDDVLRLSLLTLVYRAAPRPAGSVMTFSSDCIKAARATLERHQDCIVVMRKSNEAYFPTYFHWTLLFAPFTPFIVIFCQVIETQNQTDLAYLHAFVTSIQSAPTVSDAAARMHRLFQVLYSVALRYVEFRTSTPQTCQAKASAEMDSYLAALGFPFAGLGDGQQHQLQQQPHSGFEQGAGDGMGEGRRPSASPVMSMGNGTQLEDWFNSNQAMMELLQQPALDFPIPT